MANPNRCMAYVAKKASDYATFPSTQYGKACRFARVAREAGYTVKETRFRVGPRNENGFSYRVSVYYTGEQAAPDMAAFRAIAEKV